MKRFIKSVGHPRRNQGWRPVRQIIGLDRVRRATDRHALITAWLATSTIETSSLRAFALKHLLVGAEGDSTGTSAHRDIVFYLPVAVLTIATMFAWPSETNAILLSLVVAMPSGVTLPLPLTAMPSGPAPVGTSFSMSFSAMLIT